MKRNPEQANSRRYWVTNLLQQSLILLLIGVLWFISTTTAIVLADPLQSNATSNSPSLEQATLTSLDFDPNTISSEKVTQFIQACLQVVALIERREGELQSAESESESRRIEQDIESEALALIEAAGLTRQEYLQLLGLTNTDPEFGERVAIQLQEAIS